MDTGHVLVQLSQRNEMQLMRVFLFHETERVYDGHKNVTNAATVSGKTYIVYYIYYSL